MIIVQFIDSLANGGAEKFCVELSNELGNGHEVILCSAKRIEDWMVAPRKLKATVRFVTLDVRSNYSLMLFFKLFGLLKREKPDVVQVHTSILMLYMAVLSLFFNKIKFIQTVHNTLTAGYVKLFNFLDKMPFGREKFTHVCISESIYNDFTKRYNRLNFQRIDNGINPLVTTLTLMQTQKEIEKLKNNDQTKVFIAIGNYSDFKNFVTLTEIFNELTTKKENILLLIAGGGESTNQKNYKLVSKIKGRSVYQLGFRDDIADLLRCSNALVMSSTKEGMPLVVLEALSLGLPVISTPAGGVVDIIEDGENGFITEDFSKKALRESILKFITLDDTAVEKIRKRNQQKYTDQYSMESCANNYLTLFIQN